MCFRGFALLARRELKTSIRCATGIPASAIETVTLAVPALLAPSLLIPYADFQLESPARSCFDGATIDLAECDGSGRGRRGSGLQEEKVAFPSRIYLYEGERRVGRGSKRF